MNLNLHIDQETEDLKERIKFLEIEISLTASEKADIEKQIHQYEIQYNQELGELIERILERRRDKLKEETKSNKSKEQEYQQATEDYEEFKSTFEEIKKSKQFELTEEEQFDIRSKFKKACKLCHPDKVADEFKEEAQKIFVELKEAYDSNNLKKVTEILDQLEKGIFKMGSESITEKEKLLILHNNLRIKLDKLRNELKDLKSIEVYRVISSIKDIDSHFENLRQQLTKELNNI